MILGYNQARPTAENYHDFQSKLVSGLKNLDIEGLSLMFYGSFVRGIIILEEVILTQY